MEHMTVEGVLGARVEIDLCSRCRAFWFDPFETVHLTPASTLKIFGLIADQSSPAPEAFPSDSYCPKCGMRLHLAHDRQRNTPFQYWRCEQEHGRFTPFIDFLREKEFVRALSPEQMTELRQNIRIVNCSNCGAPIDLTHDSVCAHCGAAVSMIDMKKMVELAKSAGNAAAAQTAPPPAHDASQLAALLLTQQSRTSSSVNLIDIGLQAVADWLTNLAE